MICGCTNLQVSAFFSVEFNFTVSLFYLCLYVTAYHGKKEIMNSNTEIYGVLKVTVLCHIIIILPAVLQWH